MAKDNICSQINALINELANDNDNLRQRLNETQAQLDKANAQLQEGNIPDVVSVSEPDSKEFDDWLNHLVVKKWFSYEILNDNQEKKFRETYKQALIDIMDWIKTKAQK